jgi:hypothetical protein
VSREKKKKRKKKEKIILIGRLIQDWALRTRRRKRRKW